MFNLERHVEYGRTIDELNRVLELFETKKASSILLTDFSHLFTCNLFIYLYLTRIWDDFNIYPSLEIDSFND